MEPCYEQAKEAEVIFVKSGGILPWRGGGGGGEAMNLIICRVLAKSLKLVT